MHDCCNFSVFPTLNVITGDILVVGLPGYHVIRSMLLVFWYRQRLVHNSSSTYIFCQSLPTLQRGLSAIAELLVSSSLKEKVQEKNMALAKTYNPGNVPVFDKRNYASLHLMCRY